MELITTTQASKIRGQLSCYDRIILTGTLPVLSNADQMTSYLYIHQIRIFDYAKFAEPYRDKIKENAQVIARSNGVEIEYLKKSGIRKESIIEKKIQTRGDHPGLVHILSVMEGCTTYKPWHDKTTHKTFLRYDQSKCLTYYFYFIDPALGLCYVRVPTWLPFKLQVYFNGHSWLSSTLNKKKIKHSIIDNSIVNLSDWKRAQELSDQLKVTDLHKILDQFATQFCPVHKEFNQQYHWSIMQCEYSTDIVFHKQQELKPIYEELIATAMHTVKPDHVATFLGKKLHGNYLKEIGNQYDVRIEGSRIKHHMSNKASIKMYDKFGHVLRIETTVNDVTFFKHYREVIQRNGEPVYKEAAMRKHIYSLPDLQKILLNSNEKYIEFISCINDPTNGIKKVEKISEPMVVENRRYAGFNFFNKSDQELFLTILRGEYLINGFRSKDIATKLNCSNSKLSRLIKRLRVHGIIKKIVNSYKYCITKLGQEILICAFKIKNVQLIPKLSN